MIRAATLKNLDRILGPPLCRLLPQPPAHDGGGSMRQTLVIRPGGIGDGALLAPALKALKKRFPQSRLTMLAEQRNARVFQLVPAVDQVLRYDAPREFLAALRLRADLVIDTEQYHRLSAIVARLLGARVSIGFATNQRARLFHHAIPYSHDDYEIDSFLHLLTPLEIVAPAPSAPFLTVPRTAQARADQLLAARAGKPFVTIFPGASIPERRWGADRFAQVATTLHRQGYAIVVVGGREDNAAAAKIAEAAGGLNLAGQTSLAETAAIIAQSALLVSGDSGVLHLAAGLGTPTVSLFGPGIAKKWAPRGKRHIVINKELPCSPCTRFGYTPRCSKGALCLRQISVQEVTAAATALLAQTPRPSQNP